MKTFAADAPPSCFETVPKDRDSLAARGLKVYASATGSTSRAIIPVSTEFVG